MPEQKRFWGKKKRKSKSWHTLKSWDDLNNLSHESFQTIWKHHTVSNLCNKVKKLTLNLRLNKPNWDEYQIYENENHLVKSQKYEINRSLIMRRFSEKMIWTCVFLKLAEIVFHRDATWGWHKIRCVEHENYTQSCLGSTASCSEARSLG